MKRSTPLRRTPFKRGPTPPRRSRPDVEAGTEISPDASLVVMSGRTVIPLHRGTYAGATSGTPVAKENASQSAAYQIAVRSLGYCMNCGCTLRVGERQFCHADQGKGQGLKTDVRRGWLGCAGCHRYIGTDRKGLAKSARRAMEEHLAWKTRCTVRRLGLWPKSLPDTWIEKDQQQPVETP